MEFLKTFLMMVGAFLVAIVLLLLLIYLWIRYKLRSFVKTMGESIEKFGATAELVPPFRINLERRDPDEEETPNEDEVEAIDAALTEAGFQRIGDFAANELPYVVLWAFCDPKRRVYAVIYDHVQFGTWLDLASMYEDGRIVTASTSETSGLERPPFLSLQHHPGAEPNELLEHFLTTRPKGKLRPTPAKSFTATFEEAHAREMDWRAERGGPSEAEILAIAGKGGVEADPETVEMVRRAWQSQISEHLAEQLQEAYLDESGVSARRWEEVRDRLVFIHDRSSADELLELCESSFAEEFDEEDDDAEDYDDDEYEAAWNQRQDELRRLTEGLPPRQAFPKMNEKFRADCRYTKIGEVSRPVAADVYLMPDEEE